MMEGTGTVHEIVEMIDTAVAGMAVVAINSVEIGIVAVVPIEEMTIVVAAVEVGVVGAHLTRVALPISCDA